MRPTDHHSELSDACYPDYNGRVVGSVTSAAVDQRWYEAVLDVAPDIVCCLHLEHTCRYIGGGRLHRLSSNSTVG